MYKSLLRPIAFFILIVSLTQCKKNDDNSTTAAKQILPGIYYGVTHLRVQYQQLGSAYSFLNKDTSYVDSLVVTAAAGSALLIEHDSLVLSTSPNGYINTQIYHHIATANFPANTDSIYYKSHDYGSGGSGSGSTVDIDFTGKKH